MSEVLFDQLRAAAASSSRGPDELIIAKFRAFHDCHEVLPAPRPHLGNAAIVEIPAPAARGEDSSFGRDFPLRLISLERCQARRKALVLALAQQIEQLVKITPLELGDIDQ